MIALGIAGLMKMAWAWGIVLAVMIGEWIYEELHRDQE